MTMIRLCLRPACCFLALLFLPRIQAGFNAPVLFPFLQCAVRLLTTLSLTELSFDNFDQYFNDDSEFILAQTGHYFGSDGIEEYIKFVVAEFSQYIESTVFLGQQFDFVEYDRTSAQCVFRLIGHARNVMNSNFTSSNADYEYAVMLKLFLNYQDGFVDNVYAYFTDFILDLYTNNFLNSDNTRKFVCRVMEGPCASHLDEEPPSDCFAALSALPMAHNVIYVDGNSQGCRALHASFAETNPKHCAHLSFSPQVDSNGKIKCQESEGMRVNDLFLEQDMAAFHQFCENNGIDPDTGVKN